VVQSDNATERKWNPSNTAFFSTGPVVAPPKRLLERERCELAQKAQVGPLIPVGIRLRKAEVGPTSGPTWRLSHLLSQQPGGWLPGKSALAARVIVISSVIVPAMLLPNRGR
jgi:hypothetical protein